MRSIIRRACDFSSEAFCSLLGSSFASIIQRRRQSRGRRSGRRVMPGFSFPLSDNRAVLGKIQIMGVNGLRFSRNLHWDWEEERLNDHLFSRDMARQVLSAVVSQSWWSIPGRNFHRAYLRLYLPILEACKPSFLWHKQLWRWWSEIRLVWTSHDISNLHLFAWVCARLPIST